MADRPHGRSKYKHDHCRCGVCLKANRDYVKANNRQRAYGRVALVDATPARQHVIQLQADGMGYRRIAAAAGVGTSVMSKLIYGTPTRNMVPSKRIRPETARKLLAVRLDLAAGTNVDAIGTHRRLQALVAIGYAQSSLASRLGMTRANFGSMMGYEQVLKATAQAVAELYDELWNQPPAPSDHRTRISVNRAKNYAKARSWVPPLAWDDDTIDDPAATPQGVRDGAVVRKGKLPPAEDLRNLLEMGESNATLAVRYGVREESVRKALGRIAATSQEQASESTADTEEVAA